MLWGLHVEDSLGATLEFSSGRSRENSLKKLEKKYPENHFQIMGNL